MWSSLFGGYSDPYDDGWGVNRSGWAEKSDAAIRRENAANDLFDAFLKKCASYDPNDKSIFPITEEVDKANVYLTGPCYTSFRKRVLAKNCKVKRREATPQERKESGDKRKGKLYVISITCTVHPTKAADAKAKADLAVAERKKKAQAAAERKAEKERKEREERERLAKLQRAKVRDMYESIVGSESGNEDMNRKQPSSADKAGGVGTMAEKAGGISTMDAYVNVNVSSEALLKHAQTVHEKRKNDIFSSISKERNDLLAELRRKHAKEENELRSQMSSKQAELLNAASDEYGEIKAKIEEEYNKKMAAKTP